MSWLVVVSGSTRWGIGSDEVVELCSTSRAVRVRLRDLTLVVDDVVGVRAVLEQFVLGPVLQAMWHWPATGLSIDEGQPVVLIDPSRPPPFLVEHGGASRGATPDECESPRVQEVP